jgi:putative spermidine/putrescine transport system permease protein
MIVMFTAFRTLDPQYAKAAASLGASPARSFATVTFPLVSPAVVSAVLFVLVTAFSDLVMAQFLGGTQADTLERQMYRSIREEVSPEVAAVGTLLLAFTIALGGLVALLQAHRHRIGAAISRISTRSAQPTEQEAKHHVVQH